MKDDSTPYIDNEISLIEELNILYQRRFIKKEYFKETNEFKPINLTQVQRQHIYEKTDGLCHICGVELEINSFQADHIKPFSSGGNDVVDNFLPACSQCNNYRWDYSSEEIQWILKLGVWLKTKIQKRSKEGLYILPKFIEDEIKREKRRKNPRIPKVIDVDYKDLLPVKGKLNFGVKATNFLEIEQARNIIKKYLITNIISDDNFFNSKSFLISGESNVDRNTLEMFIKEKGGIIKTSITSKLDYMIIGNFYGYSKIIKLLEINNNNEKKILILLSKNIEITFANNIYIP